MPRRLASATLAAAVGPASNEHTSTQLTINADTKARLDILDVPMQSSQKTLIKIKVEPLTPREVK
jgi:hypothetical protein